jgi:hypothetical protein
VTGDERNEPAIIHSSDGIELTVTLLEVIDGAKASYESDVPEGSRLVGARFRIENTGLASYDDNVASGAFLIDTSDQQYEHSWRISIAVPELSAIRLEPGDRRAGMIAFLVPNSEQPASVTLSLEAGHGPDRALWKLVE